MENSWFSGAQFFTKNKKLSDRPICVAKSFLKKVYIGNSMIFLTDLMLNIQKYNFK